MNILIVGSGKLARELLNDLKFDSALSWEKRPKGNEFSIVVHAGSGRELDDVFAYCRRTQSILVELSTGSAVEGMESEFPIVLCPNVNVLMLKFMNMIAKAGNLFRDYDISFVESHQAQKKSTPGTAVFMADALGLFDKDIVSIRDREIQKNKLDISEEHLARHAVHQIQIEDGGCTLKLESRVFGDSAYAPGVSQILEVLMEQKLDSRVYGVDEFIDKGWL